MEKKIMQQRENVRTANGEKRQERQSKNEAIRVKYGLLYFENFYFLKFLKLKLIIIYSKRPKAKYVYPNGLIFFGTIVGVT